MIPAHERQQDDVADALHTGETLLADSHTNREMLLLTSLGDLVQLFIAQWRQDYPGDSERAVRFITAASLLLEWKALLLLPPPKGEDIPDEADDDNNVLRREDFNPESYRHLVEYLTEQFYARQLMLHRDPLPPGALQTEAVNPLEKVSYDDLQTALLRIVQRLLTEMEEDELLLIPPEKVSRRECYMWLQNTMQEHLTLDVIMLFRLCPPVRAYRVIVFILLLEFIHQQKITLSFSNETALLLHWILP